MDNTTATGFFTNIIFMAIKLKNVYVIITNKSNEYVSAYLTDFVKYNDINRLKKENIMKSMRFDYNRSDTTRNINDYREDILNYSESNYSSISSRESFNTSISGDSYERCKSIESTESEIATAEKC
jgi:ABC-type proline/glycine betaine transport system ATPase subunit